MILTFTAPLWLWNGKGSWHFVTLPEGEAMMIRMAVPRRGFGSVRVKARVGDTAFATSLFPDSKSASYLLPVKADVRKSERLVPGDAVTVTLSLDL
ncbi:MAG: DUF1905 domain-containing protein [Proteobacteria bacterium]|nr:DUF1905 domain-containing protein [Pseudomonadota bacterium]